MGQAERDLRQGSQAAGEVLRRRRPDATGDADRKKGVVTKAWVFRYQIDKRERAMGLGSARVVSLAEARAKANEARKLLAAGIDPLAHRNAERMAARAAELHTATFKQCLDGFLISHGDGWRTKHRRQWQNSMATYCRPLMGVAVGDIDVGMVLQVIEPEWKRAPTTMDRVRSRIGEVLGLGADARPAGARPVADRLEEPSRQDAAASARAEAGRSSRGDDL